MEKHYAIFNHKGKFKGIANKETVKYYKDVRNNKVKKILLDEVDIDINIVKDKILQINDEFSYEPLVVTNSELEVLPTVVSDFVFNFRDILQNIDDCLPMIKDESYRVMIKEGIDILDTKLIDIISSGDFVEGELKIYELIDEFGGE